MLNPLPSRRAIALDLAVLLALAAFLGLWGGAPFYHPDTLIDKALRTLAQGGNPKFFNYPALLLYLDGFLYQDWLKALLPGAPAPLDGYLAAVRAGTAWERGLFVPGQLVTLAFSLLGVAATYLAALHLLRSRGAACSAGLILATCLLWATDAHYITVDTPLTGLGMAVVALTLWVTGAGGSNGSTLPRWPVLLGLGALAGLTAAAKYNGALVLLAPAAATLLATTQRWRWLLGMLVLGAAALAAFFAANPYIFLLSPQFFKDFSYELEHARVGHAGFTADPAGLYHLLTTLPLALGWPLMALAALGLAWLLRMRSVALAHKVGLLAYPLAAFVMIGGSRLAFQRYMLPFLPFLALLAAAALFALAAEARRRLPRLPGWALAATWLGLLALLVGPNLRNVLQSDWLLTQTDTRADFVKILQSSGLGAAPGTGFAGMYTNLYFNYRYKGDQAALNRATLWVFDSFSHDRWLYDRSTRLNAARQALSGGYAVIQLSPYTRPKAEVPLSVQSIYSPYLPDLYDRARPGPYLEIYLRENMADAVMAACAQQQAPCTRLPAPQGFYYQQAMQ